MNLTKEEEKVIEATDVSEERKEKYREERIQEKIVFLENWLKEFHLNCWREQEHENRKNNSLGYASKRFY